MKRSLRLLMCTVLVVFGAVVLASVSSAATRPNDRAGPLGVGAAQVVSPAAAHPDSRAGIRGVPNPVTVSTGTDWTTIGIGVGVGAAVVLVAAAGVLTIRHGHRGPHPMVPAH